MPTSPNSLPRLLAATLLSLSACQSHSEETVRAVESRSLEVDVVRWQDVALPSVGPAPVTRFALDEGRFVARLDGAEARLEDDRLVLSREALSSFRVRTTALGRGTIPATERVRPTGARGSAVIERGPALQEVFVPRPEGVEQRWIFRDRPAGEGDWVVRLAVEGAGDPSADDEGLLFGASGEEQWRYGHGEWVDSDGSHERIPARWAGGRIELRVPSHVLDTARYPASLDPIIGPELDPSTPVHGASQSDQRGVSAGWNGTEWLVAWTDTGPAGRTLRVGRVPATAPLLDSFGTVLTEDWGIGPTSVAWAGGIWWVVWETFSTASSGYSGVSAVRLSAAGVPLDATPIVVEPLEAVSGSRRAAVATNGDELLIAFHDVGGPVQVTRLAADGSIVGAATTVLIGASTFDLQYGSGHYVVVASVAGDVVRARLASDGTLLDPSPLTLVAASGTQTNPSIATDGTGFLVAFDDARSTTDGRDVWMIRLDASADPVPGSEARLPYTTGNDVEPEVAWAGWTYWVAWREGTSVGAARAVRVDATGTLLDAVPISPAGTETDRREVALAGGGDLALLLWCSDDDKIGARRFASDGSTLDAEPLHPAGAANRHMNPRIAFGGGLYLVVWADYRNMDTTSTDVWGVLLRPDGTAIDPDGFPICEAPGGQRPTDIGYDGTNFFVVWDDSRENEWSFGDIYGARVSASGAVLDPGGVPLRNGSAFEGGAGLSWDGAHYLLGWHDDRDGTLHVYASRMTATGALVDGTDGFPVHTEIRSTGGPVQSAVVGGTHFLIFQHAVRFSSGQTTSGVRVRADGTVLDTTPLLVAGVNASLTASPTEFYIVSDGGTRLLGYRIDPATGALTYEFHTSYEASHLPIAAVWDGAAYFAAYRKTVAGSGSTMHLAGLPIGADGVATEAPFDIVSGILESAAEVASDGTGHSALVYVRYDPLVPYDERRLRVRIIRASSDPLGASCDEDLDCRSRICVDGVCCDALCGGTDPTDCRACSVAAGGAADGTCTPIVAGTVCRSGSGACDAPESCNGTTVDCPPDAPAADGTACGPGDACDAVNRCVAGACTPTPAPDCDDANPCTTDSCDPSSGCAHTTTPACTYDAGPPGSGPDAGLPSCEPGARGDCDGDPINGCEQPLDDDRHCGSCGRSCSTGLHCRGGSCVDPVVQLAGGTSAVCARRMSGRAQCWGNDTLGTLGNGTAMHLFEPVYVAGTHRFTHLAVGGATACGARTDGRLVCWGAGSYGQLGDGTTTVSRDAPALVPGLTDVLDVDVSGNHVCAVVRDGRVACWGRGTSGQLGQGSLADSHSPVWVTGIDSARRVALGFEHSCALHVDSTVSCWGSTQYGQVGNELAVFERPPMTTPYELPFLVGAVDLDAGEHFTCARMRDSTLRCWGRNQNGQLGDGTLVDRPEPTLATAISGVTQHCARYQASCAIQSDGRVRCWGQLGGWEVASFENVLTPRPVHGVIDAVSVMCGSSYGCALRSTGSVDCWSGFPMGDGTSEMHHTAGAVRGMP